MRFAGIIPARFASSRLPAKPLLPVAGKPLIQWTYESALSCSRLESVWVATDHPRIRAVVEGFGGKVVLTDSRHRCGTERVAEAAAGLEADVVINIQGDWILPASSLDAVCGLLEREEVQIATACCPLDRAEAGNPNLVKVVFDSQGRALYFSRAPIPYVRQGEMACYKHFGLYGYRRETLLRLARLEETPLERAESLEQLRWLENGWTVWVAVVRENAQSVDSREDLERVRPLLENEEKFSGRLRRKPMMSGE